MYYFVRCLLWSYRLTTVQSDVWYLTVQSDVWYLTAVWRLIPDCAVWRLIPDCAVWRLILDWSLTFDTWQCDYVVLNMEPIEKIRKWCTCNITCCFSHLIKTTYNPINTSIHNCIHKRTLIATKLTPNLKRDCYTRFCSNN